MTLLLGDDTTNSLIKAYRDAQGPLYVPSSAYRAIYWSKKDPLLEAEIYNFGWHIASTSDKKENDLKGDSTKI